MSKTIDDSGYAFPLEGRGDFKRASGMTLRDWFAGQAMSAMIAVNEKVTTGKRVPYQVGVSATATACYEIADAMIAARKGIVR